MRKKFLIPFFTLVILLAAYTWLVRPWHFRWGTTAEEYARGWPGDELLAAPPASPVTRAITIHAPAEAVWAWVAQIGQERGGFYSYTWLENLFGCEMVNADRIHPEWQQRKPGENLWLTPPRKYGGVGRLVVTRFEPPRIMVLVSPPDAEALKKGGHASQFVWSFVVEPIDARSSRLICHGAGGHKEDIGGLLASFLAWEPMHFVMERRMMIGIKERAEAAIHGGAQAGMKR